MTLCEIINCIHFFVTLLIINYYLHEMFQSLTVYLQKIINLTIKLLLMCRLVSITTRFLTEYLDF